MTSEEKKLWRGRAWLRLAAKRERERKAAEAFARWLEKLDREAKA